MHWLTDPGNRIGLYWALAAGIYAYLAAGALRNMIREFRRPRLAVCLFGVAGFFVMLAAPFLAAVQVLVYMGAIVILIIFGVIALIVNK